MKLIQQSAELWEQPEGEVGIYKQVEKAARLCYRSEDKITEDSYKRFIEMISSKGHLSPFEHGTVYLITNDCFVALRYKDNPYSRTVTVKKSITDVTYYITSNYRVLKEHGWENDLQYLCKPTEYHAKRISVHITTSIGISRELNRYRCHSICEESTRYCNYSKDKFGNEITFIIPNWLNIPEGKAYWYDGICFRVGASDSHPEIFLSVVPSVDFSKKEASEIDMFLSHLNSAEQKYKYYLENGRKPQQAREILPLSTKTELLHTAFEDDWQEFFRLRCSPAAHPMMQDLANKIKDLIHIDN